MFADREFAKNFSIQNELGVQDVTLNSIQRQYAWKDWIYKHRYYIIGILIILKL